MDQSTRALLREMAVWWYEVKEGCKTHLRNESFEREGVIIMHCNKYVP